MNDIFFYNSFSFRTLILKQYHHTDNSSGIPCHFIARMRSGSARFVTLDGEEMTVVRGDTFYLPMGLKYHSYWTPDGSDEPSAEWESYGFKTFPHPVKTHYKMQRLSPDAESASYLDQIYESKAVSPSSVGWLYLFLGKLLPQMEEKNPDPQAQLLAKAKRYIAERDDFKVSELARHCSMSESGLYAFFRSYAHTTPIDMKHQLKVEQAVQLLSSTDLSIEEISARLKFSSSAYFRKIVKEQTGKTPSTLRRENYLAERL